MGLLINRAKASCNAAGTGAVTPGAASSKFRTWAASGAQAGFWYDYLIEQGSDWEMGVGLYNGTTITRPGPGVDPWFESSTGGLLTVTASDTIACVANKDTLAAGSPFMPPMASYFPTTVASGTTGFSATNDRQSGLLIHPTGSTVTGDKTQSIHKTITAAGDWQVIACIKHALYPTNANNYEGIYVRRAGGRMVVFGGAVTTANIIRQNVYQLQQDGSGWLASNLDNATPCDWTWNRITYTASSGTLFWDVTTDIAGKNWNGLGNWTTTTLNMGGAPTTIGIGFTTNSNSNYWPMLACSYWWDNA